MKRKLDLYGYTKQDIKMINDDTEEYYDILADEKKKKGKKPKKYFLGFLVILLIILGIGGVASYAYVKFYFTAEKFLDSSADKFNSWLKESLTISDKQNIYEFDFTDGSWQFQGNLGFISNNMDYEEFTNLNIGFDMYTNIDESLEYISLNILNKEDEFFKGEYYIDKTIGYLNIPSIYPNAIYSELDENPFIEMQNSSDYAGLIMNYQSYIDIVKKYISYMTDALMESDITTINRGLTVLYEYDINDDNKTKVNEKLNSLLNNDVLIKNYLRNLENEIIIPNMKITFEVNVITRKIVGLNVISDDYTYNGEVINENKFRITDNMNNYLEIDTYKNRINITLTSNEEQVEQLTVLCNDNVITMNYTSKDEKIKLILTEEDNDFLLSLIMEYEGVNFEINNTSSIIDENMAFKGSLEVDIDGNTMGISYDILCNKDVEVPIKLYENVVSVNDLTEEDYNIMSNNLNTLISSIPDSPIYQIISLLQIDIENEENI